MGASLLYWRMAAVSSFTSMVSDPYFGNAGSFWLFCHERLTIHPAGNIGVRREAV